MPTAGLGLADMSSLSDRRESTAPDGFHHQGPDAPSAHRRPGYPLSGCVPAEPDSVSPGNLRVASAPPRHNPLSDTGVMPPKIHHKLDPELTETTGELGAEPSNQIVYNP